MERNVLIAVLVWTDAQMKQLHSNGIKGGAPVPMKSGRPNGVRERRGRETVSAPDCCSEE